MDKTLAVYQQLRKSMSQEIVDRTKTHQAKVTSLKTALKTRLAAGALPPSTPLVMLAHGDSWFDYPLDGNRPSLFCTDIAAQLQSMGNLNPHILNVSQWGDATTAEMSLPKQLRMIAALQDSANWIGRKPDAILFSGGGNDIAGDQFCVFLDFAGREGTGLNAARFNDALGMIEASYRDLFAFRDRYAAGIPIFSHCYDFPIPNGKGVCPTVGPWLQPSLLFCGYSSIPQGVEILRQALIKFKELLAQLASETDATGKLKNNFILVDTQGTLDPAKEWANELHPYPEGFRKIAERFVSALRSHFPNRI
jgi:GDSL-like Lipase/Acylhydrolase